MCGIIGVIANNNTNVSPLLIDGLKRLEYRGYDSAGIATLSREGELLCRRSEGKLSSLEHECTANPIDGNIGIGHTRWATHGKPTRNNAHPHSTSKVAVVHNGIIENFRELRTRLEAQGHVMTSDTDTEVIPHLITQYLDNGLPPEEAVALAIRQLHGTFALAILFAGKEKFLIAARRGSPLAIGFGEGQMYIGSDTIALSPFTSRFSYLEDGDLAHITQENVRIWDENNDLVSRAVRTSAHTSAITCKNGYRHYMLKEIHEQPSVLKSVLATYMDSESGTVHLPPLPFEPEEITHINLVACGTSYYASMAGKYWLESLARIPVTLDIASEFRYRDGPLQPQGLSIFVSQSGETADTLAALRHARQQGQYVISLVNVVESSIARESDIFLPLQAGPEIGVASTKAFTTQLAVLACLTMALAEARKTVDAEKRREIMMALTQLPGMVMTTLGYEDSFRRLAREIMAANDVLYIGRGISYAVALEGALKLKELTYVHAEGIAAGELKHGPIALIDERVSVIALAPSDALFEKTCSNIQEVSARGGKVIAFCDAKGAQILKDIASYTFVMPECPPILLPMVYAIPLQLLAYYAAVAKGNDVDQPRNLAKSVTVE
jgi:glutamine---fructose-6-phosphate transaminase (isomerizing)